MPSLQAEPVRPQTRPCPILVLGLGNILLRDEGVGVHVVRALAEAELPPGVEVLDGATAGFGLVDLMAGRAKVIVVDALAGDRPPGTVLRLSPDDLLSSADRALSLHEFGLLEALAAARQLGLAPPEVVILGIQPADLRCGLELSAELAALVPQVVALILAELKGPCV